MRRRCIAVFLVLVCAGCSHQSTDKRQMTIAYRSLVSSLDPIRESTVISNSIYSNIFEPLVRRDDDMRIVPALALEWSSLDDRTWIFKIRPNVSFHDGTILTPEDVCFSLNRARNDPSSELAGSLTMLERVEAVGSDTVRIVTKDPSSVFLNRMAEIWIVQAKFFAKPLSSNSPVPGTGPYRVKEWKAGNFILLEKHEKYWGAQPVVAQVRLESIADLDQRVHGLLQQKIDMLPLLESSVMKDKAFSTDPNVTLQNIPSLMVLYLAMDVQRKKSPYVDLPVNPFLDIRVRKAVYHSINIEAIIRDIMGGGASPATQLVAPKVLGYDPKIQRLPYDPQRAKDLLKEAGYPRGFRVRLDVTNNRYQNDVQVGMAIAKNLSAVGIQAQLNPLDKNTLLRMRDTQDTSLYMAGWMDGSADAGSAFDFLVHTRVPSLAYGTANGGGYSNPDVDRLIEQSSREMEPTQRITLLEHAMQMTMSDFAILPLHIEHNVTALSPAFRWEPRSDELLFINSISLQNVN